MRPSPRPQVPEWLRPLAETGGKPSATRAAQPTAGLRATSEARASAVLLLLRDGMSGTGPVAESGTETGTESGTGGPGTETVAGTGDEDRRAAGDDVGLVLTHRSPSMRTHAGQIAFPGGRLDPGDAGPIDCALREAAEETGLERGTVTPVARWAPVRARRSRAPIYPVIGYWHRPGTLRVNSPAELDDVFLAPVAELANPDNRLMIEGRVSGFRCPAFRINGYLVWGMTAWLLDRVLRRCGWERPWDRERSFDLRDQIVNSRNRETRSELVQY